MAVSQIVMCSPDHFSVSYQINPWMQIGSSSLTTAQQQWRALHDIYVRLGYTPLVVPQQSNLPDMVFAADQGLLWGNKFILSNFRYHQRQPEPPHFLPTLKTLGLEIVTLPKEIIFEGEAEACWYQDKLLMGTGFRSNSDSVEYLRQTLHIDVVDLQLTDPYFYHLDTCLFVIDDQTVCYYPPAFSSESQAKLQTLIPRPIILSEADAQTFAGNSVALNANLVIIPTGCQQLPTQLSNLEIKYHEVNVSEFKKSGGGIHCLTLCL